MNLGSLARRARRLVSQPGPAPAADSPSAIFQPDILATVEPSEKAIIDEVRMLTMVSSERLLANMDAVRYAVRRGVPGAIVECGVWRGGSVLAMIRVLQECGVDDRDVYLYDTFEGMTAPTEVDTSRFAEPALQTWQETPEGSTPWQWAFDAEIYDLDFVKRVMKQSGYPEERVHFVQGPVEQTIPGTLPDAIAVLRLDTDWYESTMHEMQHMYPVMSAGSVLIIDDYGHWDGARRAVEEYFSTVEKPIMLARTDYSGRLGVKP
jgi:O-methyltransferase